MGRWFGFDPQKYGFATAYLMLFACFNYNCVLCAVCILFSYCCCCCCCCCFCCCLLFPSVYNPNFYFYFLLLWLQTCFSAHFSLILVL